MIYTMDKLTGNSNLLTESKYVLLLAINREEHPRGRRGCKGKGNTRRKRRKAKNICGIEELQ